MNEKLLQLCSDKIEGLYQRRRRVPETHWHYTQQANIAESKLSILAPIGTAIIGYRVGDVIRWRVPSGKRRLQVEAVLYQPEREGVLQV